MTMPAHNYYMEMALQEAQAAYEENEVPVGAVVVAGTRIIGRGHNQTVRLNEPSAHAEIIAISSACNYLGSRVLSDCSLYVTLEPCVMCAGALYWAQLAEVHFAAPDPKRGYLRYAPEALHPKTQLFTGCKAAEAEQLLKSFFKRLR